MAKPSSGGATTAKVRSALPAAVRKKAKMAVVSPAKVGAKKAAVKSSPPKMAIASRQAAATKGPSPKLAAGKGKTSVPKKSATQRIPSAKKAAPETARPMK